jgi:1,4-dihydroxy-2-naphthoate polyprenyltransferase
MVDTVMRPNLLKLHFLNLPRWFAAPFFGSSVILGGLLAGGMTLNSWLGVIAGLFLMAGGHSFNSFLDYAWTGLDKGKTEDRSAEKSYTGAQNLLANGILSLKAVLINALSWYLAALAILIYLAFQTGWPIILIGILGMLVTFWYSKAKFNWTHELALGVGVGPLPALIGMFATSSNPDWIKGILAGIPAAIILSFAGLALDEWPDAEANLKKGVKSLAYKVWETGFSLELYLAMWMMFLFVFQIFLIVIGVFKPLTGLSFLIAPPLIASFIFLKKNLNKTAFWIIIFTAVYLFLILIGQAYGNYY